MNPQLLDSLGAYISVLAVVVSIAALAFQIRAHTRTLRAQNYGKALDRLAAVQSRLSADPRAAALFNRGVRDSRSLTAEEKTQFAWTFYEIFGSFEFMFDEATRGALPPHVWDRWDATLAWWVSLPGVQDWWRNKPTPFSERFSAAVEDFIRTPRADAEAAQRWQSFLRAGSRTAAVPGGEPGGRSQSDPAGAGGHVQAVMEGQDGHAGEEANQAPDSRL